VVPLRRRVLAQARWDAAAMLRNGEQLLVVLVLPALVLVLLSRTSVVDLGGPAGAAPVDVVTPGVLALAVLSTAFTGQAIGTGFDRRGGVLRLLGTTPLGRSGLLAGRVLAVLAVEAVQVLVLGGIAVALGWRPPVAGVVAAVPLLGLGTAALVLLGLLLAGTVRAVGVLAVANLAWVLLVVGGGVVLPPSTLPGPLAALAPLLPSGALGEGLRAVLLPGGDASDLAMAVAVLLGWAVVAGLAARRWFRWD
jgi:ABC-2 type transport system permease protein